MRQLHITLLLAAGFLGASTTASYAVPGQHRAQLVAWIKHNSALTGFKSFHEELSGGTAYNARAHSSGLTFQLFSEPGGDDIVHQESLAIINPASGYSLYKHLDVAEKVIGIVYGKPTQSDLQSAKVVGDFSIYQNKEHNTVLKGKFFGYQFSGSQLMLFPLSELPQVLKTVKQCATFECGD